MGLIKKPNELVIKKTLSVLLYGQPGMGKTTLALSAPHPLLLDFDNGVHRVNAAHRVDTVQISKWEDAIEFKKMTDEIVEYQTIVVDTAGKMLSCMDEYIKNKYDKVTTTGGVLNQKGYGIRKKEFIEFISELAKKGKSVIFVAHEKEEKDGEEKRLRADIGGSSSGDLMKELDLVGYMEIIGSKIGRASCRERV